MSEGEVSANWSHVGCETKVLKVKNPSLQICLICEKWRPGLNEVIMMSALRSERPGSSLSAWSLPLLWETKTDSLALMDGAETWVGFTEWVENRVFHTFDKNRGFNFGRICSFLCLCRNTDYNKMQMVNDFTRAGPEHAAEILKDFGIGIWIHCLPA